MSTSLPSGQHVLAGRSGYIAAILTGAVFLALLLHGMFARGPWYDEFFTLYVAQPGFGWLDALRGHWLTDNHPPLFYALARATSWLGDSVEPRRLVNLLFLAWALTWLAQLARRAPDWRLALLLFGIALAGSPTALFYGAELRSNFMALAGSAMTCCGLAVLAGPHRPVPSLRTSLGLAAALLLAFNTHFTASVLTGSIAAAFIFRLSLARDWRKAGWLAVLCIAAGLPLLLTLAVQIGTIKANTQTFWLPSGFTAARWAIQAELEWMLTSNVAVTIAAVLSAFITLKVQGIRPALRDERITAALALLAGASLGIAILLTIQHWRPIVITRYLVALGPPILLALAISASAVFARLEKRSAQLLLACTVLVSFSAMGRAAVMLSHESSWYGTAERIARVANVDCPGTVIHADLAWNAPVMNLPPADNRSVMPMAYEAVAHRFKLRLEPPGSRRMAKDGCPTIFWTEHVADVDVTPEQLAASLRARGYVFGKITLHRIGRGWYAETWPN